MTKTILASIAVLSLGSAAFAANTVSSSDEIKGFHGSFAHDYTSGSTVTNNGNAQENNIVVFNNLDGDLVTGFTRLNTEAPQTFGADVTLSQGGKLQELYFTLFNSSSGGNTGSITGGTMNIKIYDNTVPYGGAGAITNPLVANFSGSVDYSADPLLPGWFLTDGFVGLNSLNIVLPQNVLITQTFTPTGTATRHGYVSFAPDVVGSSGINVYIETGALAAGYYTLGNPAVDATPGYYVVVPEPTSLAALSLGGLVLRRRRA